MKVELVTYIFFSFVLIKGDANLHNSRLTLPGEYCGTFRKGLSQIQRKNNRHLDYSANSLIITDILLIFG